MIFVPRTFFNRSEKYFFRLDFNLADWCLCVLLVAFSQRVQLSFFQFTFFVYMCVATNTNCVRRAQRIRWFCVVPHQ